GLPDYAPAQFVRTPEGEVFQIIPPGSNMRHAEGFTAAPAELYLQLYKSEENQQWLKEEREKAKKAPTLYTDRPVSEPEKKVSENMPSGVSGLDSNTQLELAALRAMLFPEQNARLPDGSLVKPQTSPNPADDSARTIG